MLARMATQRYREPVLAKAKGCRYMADRQCQSLRSKRAKWCWHICALGQLVLRICQKKLSRCRLVVSLRDRWLFDEIKVLRYVRWIAESSSGDGYIGKNVMNEDLASRSNESRR